MVRAIAAPISQYVLKVHSRCDLACDHCYVYEHADKSWRYKPRVISLQTVDMVGRRIAEHAAAHQLAEVFVVLHGGEPLLTGRTRMRAILDVLITHIAPVAGIDLRIHSNGVLLDEHWCDLFREYGVKVGVSLDGDQAANDRHRRFADGRSSHSRVLAALSLLGRPEYRDIYAGILCTIDLANDPVAVYRALVEQAPPRLDLLLPHATWKHPPHRPPGLDSPYADWLMQVYRCWDGDGRKVPIRIFDSLHSASRGGPSFTEALGTDPADLLVVDTDGAWEQPDSMKTAFDGAAATGMNVFEHPVDAVAGHPAIVARQGGVTALCATCRACPVVRVCGGGLYAHRYRPAQNSSRDAGDDTTGPHDGTEFDNPSVYCADLKALIDQVIVVEHARAVPVLAAADRQPGDRQAPAGWARHALQNRALDSLAAGHGDAAGLSVLAGLRLSEVRLLVAEVATRDTGWRDMGLRAAASAGWDLLCELDRHHRHAVQEILAHPYAYAWALRCLRPPSGADNDLDRAHLAGLAAAAALRAGAVAQLPVPVRRGLLHVPTIGAVAVDPGEGNTRLLSVSPGHWPVTPGGRWLKSRYVSAPPFAGLAVEDLDPFRDCQEWPASGRLSSSEWQAWRRRLTTAGRHLADAVPGYAKALGAGLRAVVPLCPPPAGSRSATARQAFGAVAVALPGRRAARGELSELLLHEFQHVKLSALLDLCRLLDPDCRSLLKVPWRADPRPVEGVLHGTYAYLALTHLRQAEGRPARATYLRYRSWVSHATDALLTTEGALTPAGRRFVTGMAAAAQSGGA